MERGASSRLRDARRASSRQLTTCSPSPHVVARRIAVLSELRREMTSDQLTAEQKERDGHGVLFAAAGVLSVGDHPRTARGASGGTGARTSGWSTLADPA